MRFRGVTFSSFVPRNDEADRVKEPVMAEKHRGFKFSNVTQIERERQALGPERLPPIPSGFRSMDITCLDCGHEWNAGRSGLGRFNISVGFVNITCPECGQKADAPNSEVLGT